MPTRPHHAAHLAIEVQQSLIFGRMLLAIARAMSQDYAPGGRHIGSTFPEILVVSSVMVGTLRRQAAISAEAIAQATSIPGRTVRRYAAVLVEQGILLKTRGDRYCFNPDYIPQRQSRRARRNAITAVIRAGRQLERVTR